MSDRDLYGRDVGLTRGSRAHQGQGLCHAGQDTVTLDAWFESKSRRFAIRKTVTKKHIQASTNVASTIGGKTAEIRGKGLTRVQGAEVVNSTIDPRGSDIKPSDIPTSVPTARSR